jgi:hypothetical protein
MKSQIKRDCPLWAQEKAFKKQSKGKGFRVFSTEKHFNIRNELSGEGDKDAIKRTKQN